FKHQPRLVFIERMLAQHDSPRAHRALSLVSKYRDQLDADSMHLLLARAALADGDLERATVQLQAVTKQDAPAVQRIRADILHRRGQHAEAWEALQRAADGRAAAGAHHHCVVCGRVSDTWSGYCDACERWDTFRSGLEP